MSKYVFILGAGASAHAGVPMMAEFLDRAREVYEDDLRAEWKEDFDLVFSILTELQSVHSKAQLDLSNIETVFTTFELGQTIQKLPGVKEQNFARAIHSLKIVILRTIENTMRIRISGGRLSASKDYEEFASMLIVLREKSGSWDDISIITFNYDVGVEVALALRGIPYDYCLSTPRLEVTKLLKLHGSTNWGKLVGAARLIAYPMEKLLGPLHSLAAQLASVGPRGIKLGLDAGFQDLVERAAGEEAEETPVFVPPGLFKTEYQGAMRRVWQQAAMELEEAEEVIIVGYSLPSTDLFFKHLFALGTAGPKFIRRFAVFNPENSGDVKGRFSSLLGPGVLNRFGYYPVKFDEGIKQMKEWFAA